MLYENKGNTENSKNFVMNGLLYWRRTTEHRVNPSIVATFQTQDTGMSWKYCTFECVRFWFLGRIDWKKLENGSPYWRARRQRERTSVKHSWQVVSAVTINCKEHFVFKAFSTFTKEKTLLNKYRRGTPLILNSGSFFPFEFCLETNKSASWALVSGVIYCLTNMGVKT